ncbi:MAG: hypothetical protein ACTHM2_15820 [Afipia sp.]
MVDLPPEAKVQSLKFSGGNLNLLKSLVEGRMLRQTWRWALIVVGAVFLYLQGYRHLGGENGPVVMTALVIAAIGGGLILFERRGRWK